MLSRRAPVVLAADRVCFVQCLTPAECVEPAAAGTGRSGFEASWAVNQTAPPVPRPRSAAGGSASNGSRHAPVGPGSPGQLRAAVCSGDPFLVRSVRRSIPRSRGRAATRRERPRVTMTSHGRPPHRARGWHDLQIRSSMCGHPDPFRSVRDLGRILVGCSYPSGTSQGRSPGWLPAWFPMSEVLADRFGCRGPCAFQAGHIPSWRGSCERYALLPVAAGGRWSLLLLSPLLSIAVRVTARTIVPPLGNQGGPCH